MTTDINGTPDSNFVDLGFHHPNWNYSNEPNIIPSFDQDANNISGSVQITVDKGDQIRGSVFLFIDGHMRAVMDTPTEWPMVVDSSCDVNGPHSFKVVGIDENGNVICGSTTTAIFNNELSAVTMSKGYEIGKPYYLYAFGSPSANYIVEVNDSFNDTIVYSENFTGNIQAVVGSDAFAADSLIYGLAVKGSSPEIPKIAVMISRAFSIEDYKADSPVRMVISVGSKDIEENCAEVIKAVVYAGKTKGDIRNIVYLGYANSTWDNVKHCLWLPQVKIWVHFGHGYYGYRSWWRQIIQFNGATVYSKQPPWPFNNKRVMTELGFQETHKLNFVFFHSCYGAYTTQSAEALGILPIDDPIGIGTRAFISWHGIALQQDWYAWYNSYLKILWEQLRGGYPLREAKEEAEKWVQRGFEISDNLWYYGVIDDQYIRFRYPNIN
jgi:hypothetical protein